MASYRDLIAWQRGMDLATMIYAASRAFPREEVYGLGAQIRRAAVSVPSNIAEGHGRGTPAEFKQFLRISRGSTQEVETQLVLAHLLAFVTKTDIAPALRTTDEVCRLIRGLSDSLGQ